MCLCVRGYSFFRPEINTPAQCTNFKSWHNQLLASPTLWSKWIKFLATGHPLVRRRRKNEVTGVRYLAKVVGVIPSYLMWAFRTRGDCRLRTRILWKARGRNPTSMDRNIPPRYDPNWQHIQVNTKRNWQTTTQQLIQYQITSPPPPCYNTGGNSTV